LLKTRAFAPGWQGMTLAFNTGRRNPRRHPVVEDSMDKDLKSRGIENEVRGTVKEMKGDLRGDLGDVTDNSSEHLKGRAEQLEGKIQKNFGKVEQDVDDNT
jgi:uncharacterized protein YjbJ (UPF0337 family)